MVVSTKLIDSQPAPNNCQFKRFIIDNALKHPNRTFIGPALALLGLSAIDFAVTAAVLSDTFAQDIVANFQLGHTEYFHGNKGVGPKKSFQI